MMIILFVIPPKNLSCKSNLLPVFPLRVVLMQNAEKGMVQALVFACRTILETRTKAADQIVF